MADFYIKRDSTLAPLDARLITGTGLRINLTGTTVVFRMRAKGATTNVIDRAVTILDAAQGLVRHQWLAGDTTIAGDYEAEFKLTYPDTNTKTFPSLGFISIQITETLE